VALLAVVTGTKDCWACGATSHEWISGIAIEKLPPHVPQEWAPASVTDFIKTLDT